MFVVRPAEPPNLKGKIIFHDLICDMYSMSHSIPSRFCLCNCRYQFRGYQKKDLDKTSLIHHCIVHQCTFTHSKIIKKHKNNVTKKIGDNY
jgi:hypothetical protein